MYRTIAGSLLWIAISTRPDISFAATNIARFVASPGVSHFKAIKRVLRYLKGTRCFGLCYSRDRSDRMVAFSDADFAGDLKTRRSTTGTVFMIFGAAVSWRSRLQRLVTLSTCEAELVALTETAKEAIWMRELLAAMDMDIEDKQAFTIFEDNSAALVIATNGRRKSRNKHIDIRYFWVHEKVDKNIFKIEKCATEDQLADIFTKALGIEAFVRMRAKIGVKDCSTIRASTQEEC